MTKTGTTNKRTIQAAFAKAKLPLALSQQTLNRRLLRSGGQMVEMAIVPTRKGEQIQMVLPEGEDVDVRVLGADAEHQQVVVMVREPERTFVERVWNWRTRKHEEETRTVDGATRRFLVGMDECHLFIAQMDEGTRATSVAQAHEGLRPAEVPSGKRAKKLKIKRTGEWFLIPATAEETDAIQKHVKTFGVRKKIGIGAHLGAMRGRPHVVTESVVLRRDVNGQKVLTEFVQGRVLHPDHKVVKLKAWHRVIMNTEDRSVGAQWVD